MEITINIPGLKELAESINRLAVCREDENVVRGSEQVIATQIAQAQGLSVDTPQHDILNGATEVPVETANPLPTAEVSYTLDDLSKAAMGLMDQGLQQILLNLLAEFGVESLPDLDKSQYGLFATKLREEGANI